MKFMMFFSALVLAGCASGLTPEQNLSEAVVQYAGQATPEYTHALVDLNNDSENDAVVLLQGAGWCGSGGCTMLVLKAEGSNFTVVSRSTVTRAPVRISESSSHGWQDIIVRSGGADKLMQFDKNGYPLNPSMQPAAEPKHIDSANIVLQ